MAREVSISVMEETHHVDRLFFRRRLLEAFPHFGHHRVATVVFDHTIQHDGARVCFISVSTRKQETFLLRCVPTCFTAAETVVTSATMRTGLQSP